MYSNYAILEVPNSLLPENQIFLTFAQDTTELQNSSLEILSTPVELTLGPLDVLLLS
jgi:hypothetical protein